MRQTLKDLDELLRRKYDSQLPRKLVLQFDNCSENKASLALALVFVGIWPISLSKLLYVLVQQWDNRFPPTGPPQNSTALPR